MKNALCGFILFFSSLSQVHADVVKPGSAHFNQVGALASFSWAPENYRDYLRFNPFTYDIFYYIPETVKLKKRVKVMIFNHGGGQSTMTREGSLRTVGLYAPDLVRLADDLGIIVVLPSANGLNWGGHTIGLMHEIGKLIRSELDVDPNRIALAGHSMGGMGITRNYLWLADEFSFFLPMAAGMDLSVSNAAGTTDEQINKVFNVPYIHLQGLRDHFTIFVDRCKEQLSKTQLLESSYGVKSKLNMVFYDSDHQYIYSVFKKYAEDAFRYRRNLYQKELWGSILTRDDFVVENNITYHHGAAPRYFWIEAVGSDLSKPERFDLHARILGNNVYINLKAGAYQVPAQTSKLRVYLKSGMVDLSKPVAVYINGTLSAVRNPVNPIPNIRQMDPSDSGFLFQDSIDARIPGFFLFRPTSPFKLK